MQTIGNLHGCRMDSKHIPGDGYRMSDPHPGFQFDVYVFDGRGERKGAVIYCRKLGNALKQR